MWFWKFYAGLSDSERRGKVSRIERTENREGAQACKFAPRKSVYGTSIPRYLHTCRSSCKRRGSQTFTRQTKRQEKGKRTQHPSAPQMMVRRKNHLPVYNQIKSSVHTESVRKRVPDRLSSAVRLDGSFVLQKTFVRIRRWQMDRVRLAVNSRRGEYA